MVSQNPQIQLQYQVCPIILSGGVASGIPGGALPMLNLLSPGSSGSVLRLPLLGTDLDDAFGAFNVLPGGQLINQQIGQYPFANQSVAGNAVVREPLTLSVIMDSPMRGPNAWQVKQTVFTALKQTLDSHNNSGGTYIVATPAFIYENLVMTALTDASRGNNSLPQNAWRFDFEKPLVALQELQSAANDLMGKAANGLVTNANQTGTQVPAQTAQPQAAQTYPGITVAGGPPSLFPVDIGAGLNYPPQTARGAFPYGGIS